MTRIDSQRIDAFLWTPRATPWRWLLALGATASAVAHLPVISPHLAEAPYMGEEFIVLTTACLLVALAAIICDSAVVYSLGVVTCGLAVIGYVATRLVAFPQLADDVGNWFEPLGVVSVCAESLAVIAAILGLRRRRATSVAPISAQPDLQAGPQAEVVPAGPASASPAPAPSWPAGRDGGSL
jgi:hypothetical protein